MMGVSRGIEQQNKHLSKYLGKHLGKHLRGLLFLVAGIVFALAGSSAFGQKPSSSESSPVMGQPMANQKGKAVPPENQQGELNTNNEDDADKIEAPARTVIDGNLLFKNRLKQIESLGSKKAKPAAADDGLPNLTPWLEPEADKPKEAKQERKMELNKQQEMLRSGRAKLPRKDNKLPKKDK